MLERALFHPDGRLRTGRMMTTVIVLVALAMFGALLAVVTPAWDGLPAMQTAWVIFAVVFLKLPLLALCWWLIVRNKEWPGKPVVWTARETEEILEYLRAEARKAMDSEDAVPRLGYLSGEAWHVADRADGAQKADAVSVALEIDRMLDRVRRPRPHI